MVKTRSMTRNQNHVDASSNNRIKTCDNGGAAPWSNLNHDVLLLVMMQLGVVDFLAFSAVCKSWRSLALPKKNKFMASKPPMSMFIYTRYDKDEHYLELEDFERRKFKTILPHADGRIHVGLTCGYLILFGRKTCDFWLVNPITRHELHFPRVPSHAYRGESRLAGILVFLPSISKWVFVMSNKSTNQIWYSVAGEGAWNHVSFTLPIIDIHDYKGKIYTLNADSHLQEVSHICEMSFNPESKLVLLETKNFPKQDFSFPIFVSSSENLYVMETSSRDSYMVYKLDFGEQKRVSFEETRDEYAFFICPLKYGAAVKPDTWAEPPSPSQYSRYFDTNVENAGSLLQTCGTSHINVGMIISYTTGDLFALLSLFLYIHILDHFQDFENHNWWSWDFSVYSLFVTHSLLSVAQL